MNTVDEPIVVTNKKKLKKDKKKDNIIFPEGVQMFVKFILKMENKLSPFLQFKINVSDIEFSRRLMNTLIVCNHDLFIFDFYTIPYLLCKYNIPLSIVVNEGFVTSCGTVFDEMTEKFSVKLIPRKNAVPNIINHINDGRSVVIFYDPKEYYKIDKKTSLPVIINTTKCRPVYLHYRTAVKLKKKETLIPKEYFNYNFRNIMKFFMASVIGQITIMYIKVSDNYDTYEEFIDDKKWIKPIYIK
jgi:hypothetical protein